MKVLVSDIKTQCAAEVLPADPALIVPSLNRILERFFSVGKWARTTVKWKGLSVSTSFAICYDINGQAFFTLPRGLLSVLGAGYGSTGNTSAPSPRVRYSAAQIVGGWYSFGNTYGIGDQTVGSVVEDAGDGFTTFADILTPSYLRVVTEAVEQNPTNILFRGVDQNGNDIYSGSGSGTTLGVTLNIGAATTTQTTQVFGAAPTLISKPVAYGPVSLYAVDIATNVATLIGSYAPGETSPGYRRYRLGGMQQVNSQPIPYTSVIAMTKRRFVPVVSDSDEVIPSNISAIELGFQARRYDLQNDTKTATDFWEDAIGLLNSDLNEFNGAAVPQVIFQRGSFLGEMPFIN